MALFKNYQNEIFNVVITLEALEVAVPEDKSKLGQPHWITMVIKRAEHQRLETDGEKLKYIPLKVEDEKQVAKNRKNYQQVMENLNMWDDELLDETTPGVDDNPDVSQFGYEERKTQLDAQEEDHLVSPGKIDYNRHKTHVMFNVAEEVKDRYFKRNCDFHYKVIGKGKERAYKAKELELKVEFYESKDQSSSEGIKKGDRKLNLCNYIQRGLVTECFDMNPNSRKLKGQFFLTVKISVVEASKDTDIAMMALMATRLKEPRPIDMRASYQDGTVMDDVDSDDEFEMKGATMKEAFTHFHKVFNDDQKVRQGVQGEGQVLSSAVSQLTKGVSNQLLGLGGKQVVQQDAQKDKRIKKLKEQLDRLEYEIQQKEVEKSEIAKNIEDGEKHLKYMRTQIDQDKKIYQERIDLNK